MNNYLKNPFKEEKNAQPEDVGQSEDDTADYKAIFEGLELGTEATRTGIIDNARKSGYIELKKDVYYILPGGEFLIESLAQMRISMDKYKTSTMGQALKKVYHGEITVSDSVKLAEAEIAEVFNPENQSEIHMQSDIGFFGDLIGKCPVCGKEIKRQRNFYGCTGYKEGCKFSVRTSICKRTIPVAQVQKLITEGKTDLLEGFVSPKTGKTFSAYLVLKDGRAEFDFEKKSKPVLPATDEEPPLPEPPPEK